MLQTTYYNKYSDASVRPLTAPTWPTNVSSAHAVLHHPRGSSHTNSSYLRIVSFPLCSISGPPLRRRVVILAWVPLVAIVSVAGDVVAGESVTLLLLGWIAE